MRHFRKLKKEFISDLTSYVNTYMSLHSAEHTEVFGRAMEAIDECYECTVAASAPAPPAARYEAPMKSSPGHTGGIILPKKQPTFQENLFRLIDSKGLRDSSVYKKADIDRRLFSKIRADINYHPSKPTAIKLCLALSLNITDTEKLLETAGYCLSLSDTGDLVVRYCIEHKTYNLIEVNEALYYFNQETL